MASPYHWGIEQMIAGSLPGLSSLRSYMALSLLKVKGVQSLKYDLNNSPVNDA